MRKRFLGAMLLALGIGLFGGWGSAQANSVAEPTQSMLHVCWLKDAHVNPAVCEVVRMPDAFEPAKAVVTSSVDFPDFQVVALDLREVSAEGYPVFNVQSIYYKDFLRATEPIIIVMPSPSRATVLQCAILWAGSVFSVLLSAVRTEACC